MSATALVPRRTLDDGASRTLEAARSERLRAGLNELDQSLVAHGCVTYALPPSRAERHDRERPRLCRSLELLGASRPFDDSIERRESGCHNHACPSSLSISGLPYTSRSLSKGSLEYRTPGQLPATSAAHHRVLGWLKTVVGSDRERYGKTASGWAPGDLPSARPGQRRRLFDVLPPLIELEIVLVIDTLEATPIHYRGRR
jgi:hypothetical protein